MLNSSYDNGHVCLIQDLSGKAFIFFTIENKIICGLVMNSFYVMFRLSPVFLEFSL